MTTGDARVEWSLVVETVAVIGTVVATQNNQSTNTAINSMVGKPRMFYSYLQLFIAVAVMGLAARSRG